MSEFIDLLKFLTATGDAVIPWLALGSILYAAYKLIPYIMDWFKSRVESQREMAEREAERNEILRNTNAVVENNTQTIKAMQEFIKDNENRYLSSLDAHEKMSAEREKHLQVVINRNNEGITMLNSKMDVLLDRD